ncbi:uncharacterized protein MELLADRAFT_106647 [Melampsora larici-populina 98AG31]|uniref:Uncharacterized protein n=1 Tax=Melampsora larici-populina (strain 98AG31 / pathotype 3-4-7) TaxID=747676 RepID=F4RM65_MELLP|nr:uncharacterized protein MELLADRAFT_106647 [Melampsora larici-populina 98AG31]EGG06522.1 hypothetical protein MELLADRAFT_106647 [Melampsora larici-populina 98AG31]
MSQYATYTKVVNAWVHSDQLYLSSASGEALRNTPPVTPQMLAVGGNGTAGVNSGLTEYLSNNRGKRFGIGILDWYASSPKFVLISGSNPKLNFIVLLPLFNSNVKKTENLDCMSKILNKEISGYIHSSGQDEQRKLHVLFTS